MHFPVPKTNFHPNNNDLVVSLTRAKLLGFDIKEGKIAFDHAVPNLNKDPKNLDVLNFSFSHDGSLLAVVVSDKSLVVYDTASWEIKHQTIIPKRANVVKFTPDGEYVVVGDKFGDVYRFSLKNFDKEELILGHVSVLTDLFFSSNGKLIITADRDEKIRVSKFPNGYNIENYCLGHYEFVYQAVPLTSFDGFLVSGGGDDYLNLFNYLTAKHIQKIDLTTIAELSTYTVAQLLQHEGIADRLFVILEGLNALLVFKIDNQDGVPSLSFEQKLEFEQGFEPISVAANKLGQLFVSLYNKETYASQFNGFEFDSTNQTFKPFEINGAEKFLEILTTDQVTDTKLTKINDLRKSKYDDPNKGDEEDNEEDETKEGSTTTPYRQVKKSKHKPKANPTSL